MKNFFWKLAALTLVLFGGDKVAKNMAFGLSYGMGWKKVFQTICNKGRVKTIKPSGTVSQLSAHSNGIQPTLYEYAAMGEAGAERILEAARRRARGYYDH